MALYPRRSRCRLCRRHRHCGGRRHRRAAAAAARSTARVAAGGGRSGVGIPGVSGGFCFFVTLVLPRHFGVACSEVLIALRAFFKGGKPAVPWSAIDLVQRIRIRERVVIPYLPVEARNRPVTQCSAFSLQETADSAQYEKKWPTRTGMKDSRPIFFCRRFSYNENALYLNDSTGRVFTGHVCHPEPNDFELER